MWAGEVQLQGRFDALGREHQVLFGLEKNSRKNQTQTGYLGFGTANIYANDFAAVGTIPGKSHPVTADSTISSNNEAAYGQVVVQVLDHTRLLLGARYDRAEQTAVDNLAGAVTSEVVNHEWTTRVGLVQDLSANATAYATYSESFNPVDAQRRGGQILDPETGKGYEVGLKTEWLDKRLGITAAVFRLDLENSPIEEPTNGPGESFSISAGLARTDGGKSRFRARRSQA